MPVFQYFEDGEWNDFPPRLQHNHKTGWFHTTEYTYASDAVEKLAEEIEAHDCEYPLLQGETKVFAVREVGREEITLYRVTGRAEPVYEASEITRDDMEQEEERDAHLPPGKEATP